MPAPVVVSAGRRRVTASLPGHLPASRTVELTGFEELKVELELSALAPSAPDRAAAIAPKTSPSPAPLALTPSDRPPRFSPWLWAVPAGLAAGAVVLGIVSATTRNDVTSNRYQPGASLDDQASQASRAKAFGITAGVLGGAAIVSAGVLGGLLLFGHDDGPRESHARAGTHFWLGPDGIAVAGQF
jgi:hypothetical protein